MHFRLLVTFNKESAETSEEARNFVLDTLNQDSGFVGEGSRFTETIADWFVIGGRWSSSLQMIDNYFKEARKALKVESEWGLSDKEAKDNEKKLQKVWEKLGGKGQEPYNRDTYNSIGYDDDAMIVNEKIYKNLLKEYEGKSEGYENQKYENHEWKDLHFVDLDYDEVSKDFIGKKWVVVVDYHN